MNKYEEALDFVKKHLDSKYDLEKVEVLQELVDYVSKDKLKHNASLATEKIKRNDVTEDIVLTLRESGLTIPQIAKKLNCGYYTVCKRLGMKERLLDWSDEYENTY